MTRVGAAIGAAGGPGRTTTARTYAGVVLGLGLFALLVVVGPLEGTDIRAPGTDAEAAPERPELPAAAPRRLTIPSLDVATQVADVEVGADLTLRPPRSAEHVGWWSGSARPGDSHGATVIAGHTVHTGGGALDELGTLTAGDRIEVETRHGTARYQARSVATFDYATMARRAEDLLAQDGQARLVLVTCEDWDGAAYRSNVVVVADLASVRPDSSSRVSA